MKRAATALLIAGLCTLLSTCSLFSYDYYCFGGVAAGGTTTNVSDSHKCVSCREGYTLSNNQCTYTGGTTITRGTTGRGGVCNISNNCATGLYCVLKRCGDGSVGDRCESDRQCKLAYGACDIWVSDGDPQSNVCESLKPDGAGCFKHTQCAGGACVNNLCQ